MNSREKGKRGELEWAKVCCEHGYEARRGQQFCGADGSADVVGIPGVHLEVKRVERLNVDKAMVQSISDAREDEIPVVAHRKNGGKWLVTMTASDWFQLIERYVKEKEDDER